MELAQTGGATDHAVWHALCQDVACRVLVIESGGALLYVNEGTSEYFGVGSEQLVGQQLTDLYPAEIRGVVRAWLDRVLASDPATTTPVSEYHVFRGFHWSMRGRPLVWDTGQSCVLCVGQVVDEPTPLDMLLKRVKRLSDRNAALGSLAVLSDRELEVAMLISGGLADSEVALALHRSLRTVHSHRLTIGRKLELRRRSEVARLMIERGLVGCIGEQTKMPKSYFVVSNGLRDESAATSKPVGVSDASKPQGRDLPA